MIAFRSKTALHFQAACLGIGLFCSASTPLFAQKPGTPERAANAWTLASTAGVTMALYDSGADQKLVKKQADVVHKVAAEMKIELPSPPEKTGTKADDSAAVLNFLLKDLSKTIGDSLVAGKETALAEIGLKSGVLLITYAPGEDTAKSLAKVLKARAKKAGLAEDIMDDVVEKIEADAPYAELRDAVMEMEKAVTEELSGEDAEAEPEEKAADASADTDKGAKPKEKKAMPSKEKAELSEGSQILENALGSMGKATGYNIKASLIISKGKQAELTGAFGIKKMDLLTVSPDKKEKAHRIIVDGVAAISKDGDKTWKKDEDTDSIALLSNTITGPISQSLGVTKELDFKIIGEEEAAGETVLHVQGKVTDSKGKELTHDYWIARDKELTTVVRRCKIPVEFNDMEVVADINYTEINSPKPVKLPKGFSAE